MNINWYPGHMKVTMDNLKKSLKLVDIVIEIIDARIPISSRNPVLDTIVEKKPRIILINKKDLASPDETIKWKNYFEKQGYGVLLVDGVKNQGLKELRNKMEEKLSSKFERDKNRNIIDETIKMMIVGIPNVGKSTIINTLSKRSGAKVGNKPGVTRTNQWIKTSDKIELLDTPGVLWPKFEDKEIGLNLAFTGAIEDTILDVENLALEFIKRLMLIDENIIKDRYNIDFDGETALEIMEMIALKRGAILKGKEIDYFKVANILLNEFRKGQLGRITLERVNE